MSNQDPLQPTTTTKPVALPPQLALEVPKHAEDVDDKDKSNDKDRKAVLSLPNVLSPPTKVTSPLSPSARPPTEALKGFRVEAGPQYQFSSWAAAPNPLEGQRIQREIEDRLISTLQFEESEAGSFHLSQVLQFLTHGVRVTAQDDFSKCFQSQAHEPWNWNSYLLIIWLIGVAIRYLILFPLRLLCVLLGNLGGLAMFFAAQSIWRNDPEKRAHYERKIIRFICSAYVLSWTGVIKYHGTIPKKVPNRIYVANHTSIIDMIVLQQMNTFSLVGQKHPGLMGWMQDHLFASLGCVWFNRAEAKDRQATAKKIKEHVLDPDSNRLLVFPEGTCVNNEYCVQFKRGVFEMGCEVCPIAMKYNRIFADAFWNSRQQSFLGHLISLMCSWAVVCDVWYLPPQQIREGETGIDFSNRVKDMIAQRAGLKSTDWDGYLKHFKPSERYVQERQKLLARVLLEKLTPEERQAAMKEQLAAPTQKDSKKDQ